MEGELKTAVYAKLDAALSIPIYNGAPLDAALPYVDIDDYSQSDWSGKDYTGTEAALRVHVWHRDRDSCATIMTAIRAALDRVALTISGHNFVDCQYENSRSFTDADGLTRHGVIDFKVWAN
ncbi:DUF3168 domain-containing protein [Paremcibacter congregatus]|uniref:DUF3168 domain-containing protein n=1 Tax=Paremcibacter congregatus TaxID=2043170 RepID=UPI0030EED302|tara:strand:- start:4842 stop:5207 length:366 start_codon:yes stop_codon:yes gene_type:complete